MKVLGIGNAIVDVICRVDDNFLIKNGLTKSTMKLIDENEFKKLSLCLSTQNLSESVIADLFFNDNALLNVSIGLPLSQR